MGTGLSHLQVNIKPENVEFYRKLLPLVGWELGFNDETTVSGNGEDGIQVWFLSVANDSVNDYDGPGVNHISINAPTIADVDRVGAELQQQGVELLFGTPQHRPDFVSGDSTYYQIMFESPDKLLFEFVYVGPK